MTRPVLAAPVLALVVAACAAPEPGPVVPPPPVRHADAAVAPVAAASAPRDERASRSSSRLKVSKSWARGDWARFPRRFEVAAYGVARHESMTAGLWTARNGRSSASGFAQWLDSTWRTHARNAGVKHVPPRAYLASPRKQARVFADAWTYNKGAWCGTGVRGTGCAAW